MNKIDYDKYSTEELREMLLQIVNKLSEEQCAEIINEINS